MEMEAFMLKYYISLWKWVFKGSYKVLAAINLIVTIFGKATVWIFPQWSTIITDLFWMIPAGILVFWIFARAIRAPYIKFIEQKGEVAHPNIHLLISHMNIYCYSANTTGIALIAKIWNTGNPVRIIDWYLEIIPEGQIPKKAVYRQFPDILTLTGNPNIIIHSHESLDKKIGVNPISDVPIEGYLLFIVDASKDIIFQPLSAFHLSVKDIYENAYRCSTF
jgi:hypothetical protein